MFNNTNHIKTDSNDIKQTITMNWIRNVWQSLAYSPLGTAVSPLVGSSKT